MRRLAPFWHYRNRCTRAVEVFLSGRRSEVRILSPRPTSVGSFNSHVLVRFAYATAFAGLACLGVRRYFLFAPFKRV